MEPSRYQVRSTVLQIKQFCQYPVWQDILALLREGIEDGHEDLEAQGLGPCETEFIRGRLYQIRQLLALPGEMIHLRREQTQEASEEAEEEDENG